jgi:hypothetical protein
MRYSHPWENQGLSSLIGITQASTQTMSGISHKQHTLLFCQPMININSILIHKPVGLPSQGVSSEGGKAGNGFDERFILVPPFRFSPKRYLENIC